MIIGNRESGTGNLAQPYGYVGIHELTVLHAVPRRLPEAEVAVIDGTGWRSVRRLLFLGYGIPL